MEEARRILVKCPLCNMKFSNVHSLFGHMLNKHCDFEGYFIAEESEVREEEEKEEEYFKCPFCRRRFKVQEKLFRHIVLNHIENLKKMYKEGSEDLKKQVLFTIEKAKEFGYLPEDFTLEEPSEEPQESPESSS